MNNIVQKWKKTIHYLKTNSLKIERYNLVKQNNSYRFIDEETQQLFMPDIEQISFGKFSSTGKIINRNYS